MSEHDPFNEPETAHPRARELMKESFFWDCVNELAPFGSDEGFDAYYEWRGWREENPQLGLKDCLAWILDGKIDDYNSHLYSNECIKKDLENPDGALLSEAYDMFTLDTTIIATGLGQLLDEGIIDANAKPYILVAVNRQLHPSVCIDVEHKEILNAIKSVVEAG